jgi:Zn-dependent peptidase ImmA (M78 family)/transcriptional regulator with XRE-family HTH domain
LEKAGGQEGRRSSMTATTLGFIGKRLIEARRARGVSATDLADRIGISVQSVSKYENGHQFPKLEVLYTIASTLKMPRSYFLRPVNEEDTNPIFWRARLSSPPTMRERAAVRLEWMKEIVDYLASYFDFPSLNIPLIKIPEIESIGVDFLEEVAAAIRAHWDIRPGPMPDVIEKLETNGILVSRIHVGAEKLDAFSQWSNRFNMPFVVLSRDKASAVRQRFDALHELSHITLHKNIPQKRLNDRAFYKAIEKQADRLACCLLLPKKEFVEELYAPSLDGFLAIKERWGASVGAMIMRCRLLGLLDDEEAKRMWINYARRGWRDGEPLDGKIQKEAPYMIRRSFEMLMSEGVQSASDIKNALPFPPEDLEELADLEPGTLTGNIHARAEPILKEPFRNENANVVQLFKDKRS